MEPYSNDYNTVLEEAQRDQNAQARPELADHVENMDEYDIVMIGYPNWLAYHNLIQCTQAWLWVQILTIGICDTEKV